MHIRDVLHEQHDEDVILVLGWVHGATERVTGFPEDIVDFVLGNGEEGRAIVIMPKSFFLIFLDFGARTLFCLI